MYLNNVSKISLLIHCFDKDCAMTGKNDDRPAFKEMIADSAKERWDYVLVWKLDRFAAGVLSKALHDGQQPHAVFLQLAAVYCTVHGVPRKAAVP